jgi:hypothetical protein
MMPTIVPPDAVFPDGPVTVLIYGKKGALLTTYTGVVAGDVLLIEDKVNKPYKIPTDIKIEIYDGGTLLQTIQFHGSCSEPLNVGDELGAITIYKGGWD